MSEETNIEITRIIDENQITMAVEIYYEAFKKKIRALIKSKEKVFQIYFRAFKENDHIFYALIANRVVGLIGLQFENKNFIELTYNELREFFNPFQSCFINFIYKISSPKLNEDVLRIDSIAVDSSFRSLGIGTKLINKVFEFAKIKGGFREVVLEVVNTNPRAKILYEKLGFKQKKIIRYYFLTRSAGFSSEYIMSHIL